MGSCYKNIVVPILDRLDSETMHNAARQGLHLAEGSAAGRFVLEYLARGGTRVESPKLHTSVAGITFENPLVVGAGWDKTGQSVRGLVLLGFAGVEVGTVVQYPQPGNPKPRQWVIGKGVAINALGFPSPGMEVTAQNLSRYNDLKNPIGINFGRNKEVSNADAPANHAAVAKLFAHRATYMVINVSSPNTPGLRELQDKELLTDIVQAVKQALQEAGTVPPIFVKIAPDLTNDAVNDVIRVVADQHLAGLIATNTTISSDLKARYGERWREQRGGLSGNDTEYRKMATEKISHIYRETGGKMEIIGVGGINSAETALEKIRAGARVVQIVTALRGEGPSVANTINAGLLAYLEREGLTSITQLVGTGLRL